MDPVSDQSQGGSRPLRTGFTITNVQFQPAEQPKASARTVPISTTEAEKAQK